MQFSHSIIEGDLMGLTSKFTVPSWGIPDTHSVDISKILWLQNTLGNFLYLVSVVDSTSIKEPEGSFIIYVDKTSKSILNISYITNINSYKQDLIKLSTCVKFNLPCNVLFKLADIADEEKRRLQVEKYHRYNIVSLPGKDDNSILCQNVGTDDIIKYKPLLWLNHTLRLKQDNSSDCVYQTNGINVNLFTSLLGGVK